MKRGTRFNISKLCAAQFAAALSDYQFYIPASVQHVWGFFHSPLFINLGIGIYIILTIFQLVTLPLSLMLVSVPITASES